MSTWIIVDRVRKLVALAGSPNENEARTSAHLACRLIREHGLEIRHQPDRLRMPDPPWRQTRWEPYENPAAKVDPLKWVAVIAQAMCFCWSCQRRIRAGETKWYHPNKAARCGDCGPDT